MTGSKAPLTQGERSWAPKQVAGTAAAPGLPTEVPVLPGSGPVRLAAHLTAVAMAAAVLGVGVHVVRTASRLLRH